ncbi:hypothetical protein EMIT0P4_60036 [Pseudomonas sp. IT-P4]
MGFFMPAKLPPTFTPTVILDLALNRRPPFRRTPNRAIEIGEVMASVDAGAELTHELKQD